VARMAEPNYIQWLRVIVVMRDKGRFFAAGGALVWSNQVSALHGSFNGPLRKSHVSEPSCHLPLSEQSLGRSALRGLGFFLLLGMLALVELPLLSVGFRLKMVFSLLLLRC
jgi:hypothetical protein